MTYSHNRVYGRNGSGAIRLAVRIYVLEDQC